MGGDQKNDVVEGEVERIVYQNDSNDWTVARLRTADGTEVTLVGALGTLTVGVDVHAAGEWVNDSRFGRQFRARSVLTKSPETLSGIEKYLASGLIKGIGPELAKRIVTAFGLETMSIITNDPKRLREVAGIGHSRADTIAEAWKDQQHIQEIMVFLRGHGVTAGLAMRIYKRYGDDTIAVLRQNPFRLALDVWGVGFRTADQIARDMGMARDAPERVEAGVLHALGEWASDGHTFAWRTGLVAKAEELLNIDTGHVEEAVDRLSVNNLLMIEPHGDDESVSLAELWDCETCAAERFAEQLGPTKIAKGLNVTGAIERFEKDTGVELAPAQHRAVEAAAQHKCVVITGGPGVGKTTIVRAIVDMFSSQDCAVSLAAPTGRAAKRMTESTGREALTLHRLLEFQPQSRAFERNAENPIECDLLIVDEMSMVDVALFRALVVALPFHAHIVFVGDIDQLPSVGPGAVLGDLIRSGGPYVVELTEIFRQAAESTIVQSAHAVNQGVVPELSPPSGSDPKRTDFYFIARNDPEKAQATIVDLVSKRIPERFGYSALSDVQVLCPIHRGPLGTRELNAALQEAINPASPTRAEISRGARTYRTGDKVMQIKNDYEKGVFNGDIGIVNAIAGDTVYVDLHDGRRIEYEATELDVLIHAYAVSIHKSQGSEFPVVVMPIATQHYMMLQRNLLYTGITRGKELVIIVGQARAVGMAVRNHAAVQRQTHLAERIRVQLAGG